MPQPKPFSRQNSGRFAKQEQWERWRVQRKIVSGFKHRGRFYRDTGNGKIFETVYAKSCNLVHFAGKWFAVPSLIAFLNTLRFHAFPLEMTTSTSYRHEVEVLEFQHYKYLRKYLRTLLLVVVPLASCLGSQLDIILIQTLRQVPHPTSVRSHILAEDEVPEDLTPRGVVRQSVVELGGDATNLGQPVVGNVRKIVVLDVVAEIVDEEVQRSVVAGGRLALREQVVLRDEVAGQRMKS